MRIDQIDGLALNVQGRLERVKSVLEKTRFGPHSVARLQRWQMALSSVPAQPKTMIKIREESAQDVKAVRNVNERAFGQTQEADLVDQLRQSCDHLLSLVAVVRNQVVGHILFSPATIETSQRTVHGMALAPMGVQPEYQRQGIGSKLVRTGIDRLKKWRCPFIIVLGHPDYYPRFGFKPANSYGIRGEWDVPDDTFMILLLNEAEVNNISGLLKYHPEFTK